MLAVSPTVERWHQSIAALVEHREQCHECQPGGNRCRLGRLLHQAEQAAYREASRGR